MSSADVALVVSEATRVVEAYDRWLDADGICPEPQYDDMQLAVECLRAALLGAGRPAEDK
jgi:hypothetical protein